MSVILAVLTAIVLITWGMLRKPKRESEEPVFVKRYIHPGHTWMRMTEDGDVLVGIDDFGQSLIGTIDAIKLPRVLKRVQQGEAAWEVQHNHRSIRLVSPVSGRVVQKNEMVLHNPLLVNTSPYGDGWLMRIRPNKLSGQLNNLFTGKPAQQWLDRAKTQLIRIVAPSPVLTYQDGGVIIRNVADSVSDDEWKAMEREFFLVEDESTSNRSKES